MDDTSKSTWIVAALERFERPLVRYAAWILDDGERAREIVQETFLRLCRESEPRIGAHLPQWLFTVCRNLALDVRKKENRMSPLREAEVKEYPSREPKPSTVLEEKETVNEIFRILETLPKNQREVLYLKFQCDLSYKEISSITNLSVTNIGFLIHTAIKAVRKEVTARRIQ
jgi:RNA polymerase sigma-70 factor (ECF subfamily)